MKLLVAPGLARALLAATLMAGCASAERPLAPDEIQHTTMGYRYSTDAQRLEADAKRARLAAGMTVQEVVSLLGIPTGKMMEEAISESPVIDVHYGTDLLQFREGKLVAFSRAPAASSYQRTVRLKDPFGTCNAACAEFNAAVRTRESEKVSALLRSNPELARMRPYDGTTALHAAVANGDKETASLLLASKADLAARNQSGLMPLHIAAENGDVALIRLLLAGNADVNAKARARSVDENTPLHMAVLQGRLDAAQLLIASGADVNARTKVGGGRSSATTPLSTAASTGRLDIATLLLARGADVNGAGGSVPLASAIFNRSVYKGTRQHKEVMQLLVRSGADVNAPSALGLTPLHFAASEGDEDALRLLLDNKANVNAKSQRGETPLGRARARNHSGAAQLLLAAGAQE